MYSPSQYIGLIKSIAQYYWKPFNKYRLIKFYRQFVSPGELCFDLGAHVGNRTMAWQAMGARVVAVEPQPVCVRHMRKRFAGMQSVTIVDKAVAESSGEIEMHISSANPTISTTSGKRWREQLYRDARYPVRWDTVIRVPSTTIDNLIREYGVPAFCKIDVENAEYAALLGLSQPLPALSFEYYPPAPENTFLCLQRLAVLGDYEFNWSFGESLRLASANWLTTAAMMEVLRGFSSRWEYGDIYARILNTPQI